MENTPKTSDSTLDGTKSNHLAATFETSKTSSTRPRSSSANSCMSGITEVTDIKHHSDFAAPEKEIKFKTIAGDVEIALKFGEALRLLCSFGKKKRTIKRRVKVTNVDESDGEDHEPSDYIKSIYVLSREKDETGHFTKREAQCSIDSGCHQGNFVSRSFLVEQLGIQEAEFADKPLKQHEKEGFVMTGDSLEPEGVIHLDWYHLSSNKVYRQMRFLVSSTQPCDVVIGARSIKKHRILSPPNLMNIHDLRDENEDATQKKLEGEVEDIKNDIGTYESHIKTAKRTNDDVRLQQVRAKLDKAQNSDLPAAKKRLADYTAKVAAEKKTTAQKKSQPAENSTKLPKLLARNGPVQPHIPNPDVKITDHSGITRSATGFSFTASRLTHLGRK